MRTTRSRGFTLIELLTVIAIIAILASLTAATLPRVLEKAKITRVESDFKAVEKALATYATEYGSYPPAQNFKIRRPDPEGVGIFKTDIMTTLQLKDVTGVYDRFAVGNSTPFIYIPVNLAQFTKVKKYLENLPSKPAAKYYAKGVSLTDATTGLGLPSPPTVYDAYVLLSIGPGNQVDYGGICNPDTDLANPGAILAEPGDGSPEVSALRAFFRATRDANGNKELDFDFRARTRQGDGKKTAYEGTPLPDLLYHLPIGVDDTGNVNPANPGVGQGPLIFTGGK